MSALDVDTWFGDLGRPGPFRLCPDGPTLRRLRAALEPLVPSDAARLRYRQVHRPALDILAQATLSAANPGDPA